MRLTLAFVFGALLADGQTIARPGYLGPPLRPEIGPPTVAPPVRGPRVIGRGWWANPGWTIPEVVIQAPSPEPKAKEPALIVNKDYVKERLSPQTTLFPEGLLPAPVIVRPHVPASPCTVRYKGGPVEKGRACRYEDEVLVYVNEKDRLVRVSIDMVDVEWP
jgi:hypothetical protein